MAHVAGISGGDRFDRCCVLGEVVPSQVLDSAHGSVCTFELLDEVRFALHGLPHEGVEGAFGDVREDLDALVLVALPDDAAFSLFEVSGSPGYVDVVQGDGAWLDVGAGSHLFGGAEDNGDATVSAVRVELRLFRCFRVVVDEPDGFGVHAGGDEFVLDSGVDVPRSTFGFRGRSVAENDLEPSS